MSFVADELVKWKDKPDWYSRIDFDEYERLALCIIIFLSMNFNGILI